MQNSQSPSRRNDGADLLRLLACFLVVMVHAAQNYFMADTDSANRVWSDLWGTLARPSVPLFFMISGVFLLPIKGSAGDFFKRRLGRILPPMVAWILLYTLLLCWKEGMGALQVVQTFAGILLNPPANAMHLWYLYALVGIYLFIPIISPWIAQASEKAERNFLLLWGLTLFLPYLRLIVPFVGGEAWWNRFGLFYYFTGYVGYLVLGHYLARIKLAERKGMAWLGLGLVLVAWLSSFAAQELIHAYRQRTELALWDFASINVCLMATGFYLLLMGIKLPDGLVPRIVGDLAHKSFGVYLLHFLLVFRLQEYWDRTGWSALLTIPLNTLLTFLVSYLVIKAISFLPKSKWLIG